MLIAASCPACGEIGPAPCVGCAGAVRKAGPLRPPSSVDAVVAAMLYEGRGRELVTALKYRKARVLVPWLAACIAATVRANLGGHRIDVITWVPAAPSNRRDRGFDQGRLLGRSVSAILGIPAAELLVRAGRHHQTGLARSDRLRGPVLSVRTRPFRAGLPTGVLIIDDVMTTGASLSRAAAGLRETGVPTVVAAVAAATPTHIPHGVGSVLTE